MRTSSALRVGGYKPQEEDISVGGNRSKMPGKLNRVSRGVDCRVEMEGSRDEWFSRAAKGARELNGP
jgi:hypothetical protein